MDPRNSGSNVLWMTRGHLWSLCCRELMHRKYKWNCNRTRAIRSRFGCELMALCYISTKVFCLLLESVHGKNLYMINETRETNYQHENQCSFEENKNCFVRLHIWCSNRAPTCSNDLQGASGIRLSVHQIWKLICTNGYSGAIGAGWDEGEGVVRGRMCLGVQLRFRREEIDMFLLNFNNLQLTKNWISFSLKLKKIKPVNKSKTSTPWTLTRCTQRKKQY